MFIYLISIELKKNVVLLNGYRVFVLQDEKSSEDELHVVM